MVDEERPLIEHVIELVERLRISLYALICSIVLVYILPSGVFRILKIDSPAAQPLVFYLMNSIRNYMLDFSKPNLTSLSRILGVKDKLNVKLIASGMFDSFIASFHVSLIVALFTAVPIVVYEMYKYVEPALYSHEKRVIKKYLVASYVLFGAGALYAYVFLLPLTFYIMAWLAVISGAEPVFTISSFFETVLVGIILTGIFFMFPLFFIGLVSIGLVKADVLRKKWRYVVLAMAIITAVITPDPTPITMTLLLFPFIVLYFMTIAVAEKVQASRSKIRKRRSRAIFNR